MTTKADEYARELLTVYLIGAQDDGDSTSESEDVYEQMETFDRLIEEEPQVLIQMSLALCRYSAHLALTTADMLNQYDEAITRLTAEANADRPEVPLSPPGGWTAEFLLQGIYMSAALREGA
jgi:hypothetical protein